MTNITWAKREMPLAVPSTVLKSSATINSQTIPAPSDECDD
jgi:hypothetical protein